MYFIKDVLSVKKPPKKYTKTILLDRVMSTSRLTMLKKDFMCFISMHVHYFYFIIYCVFLQGFRTF